MPIVEVVLEDRSERHDRELTERAAGRRDAKRAGSPFNRCLSSDCPEDRSETRRGHADAGECVADGQHYPFSRHRNHEHAGHVKGAASPGEPAWVIASRMRALDWDLIRAEH